MQQPYGNPPIQPPPIQQPMMSTQYGGQPPFGAPAGMAPGMGAPGGYVGSVSLAKGGNMSLTKANPNLTKIRIGLGWDVRQTGGPAFDLDASCFLLKADGRVRMAQDLIFYNNKTSVDGAVFHHGDNLTGVGEGDDEVISIDLSRVPMEIQKIVFIVSIYEAEMRQQNFGMVSRAFIRVVDDFTHQEMCRFDLSEEASLLNTMIFGEVYRYGNEWKFRAVGQGIQGGLKAIGGMFGLNLQ
jgi:tellurium resistance protein TerD